MSIMVTKQFCVLTVTSGSTKKCAGRNNFQYQLIQNNANDPWYCWPCKNDMCPFSGLSVHQFFDYITLKNSLNENPKQTNKQTGNKKLICSVCYKSNSLNKGLKYFSCDSPDYKKSAELNQCDFLFDKIIQNTYWNTLHVKMQIFHLHILVLMKYNV